MTVNSIMFSPTGGTAKVAKILADAAVAGGWNGDAGQVGQPAQAGPAAQSAQGVQDVDLTDRNANFAAVEIEPGSLTIISVPAFNGRVPAIAVERLGRIVGNGSRAVLVAVYGARAIDDTLVELQDAAVEAGFVPVAGMEAIAQHSIMPQFATDRPDAQDAQVLAQMMQTCLEKIASGDETAPNLPGSRPYKKAGGAGLVPKTSSACTQCGLCASNCPTGAIDPQDCRSTDKDLCISCMRCVRECPENARSINAVAVKAASMAIGKECRKPKSPKLFM